MDAMCSPLLSSRHKAFFELCICPLTEGSEAVSNCVDMAAAEWMQVFERLLPGTADSCLQSVFCNPPFGPGVYRCFEQISTLVKQKRIRCGLVLVPSGPQFKYLSEVSGGVGGLPVYTATLSPPLGYRLITEDAAGLDADSSYGTFNVER
jgi:hypothetical protein